MKKGIILMLFLAMVVFSGCSSQDSNQRSSQVPPPNSGLVTVTPLPPNSGKVVAGTPTASDSPSISYGTLNGPRIGFTSDFADRGRIYYDTAIEQVYEFRNVGSDILELTDAPTIKALEGC